ncbi:hypothetical protein J2Z62_000276 [Mycoplasmoides fastidiosum]|uniref:Uncharacterized protein n=1 Tax=Mycoplasmoides fastidiosum TaxID=92758 RepID=A0ABU0LZ08_9BACT|nr:hypothetical protein [Mycoplasmoides fastidiosum]MDQ0513838.1 hypothetical protein [Mycoplasmoides fastidiosum]UUD37746.1 hypothetical protein NPA10_04245 [Mycoplasmoides fastidiosum]
MNIFTKLKKSWNQKFNKSLSIKKVAVATLVLTGIGVTAGSTYSIVQNFKLGGDYVDGYIGKIGLNPFNEPLTSSSASNNQGFGIYKLEGKEYDFDNPDVLNSGISQAEIALTNFNNSLGRRDFFVNRSNANSVTDNNATRLLNLYFHAPSLGQIKNEDPTNQNTKPQIDYNHNNAWFRHVSFNQISIDRYGFDYNQDGSATVGGGPKLHTLVQYNNIGTANMRYLSANINGSEGVGFNIYDQNIPKSEISILANTNSSLYVIPSQFSNTASNTWQVWLDKDLLALRLNYIYQTYVFNQDWAYSLNAVQRVIGNPNINNGQTDVQKANYQTIRQNYYALSANEKKFAEDYIKIVVNSNTANRSNTDAVDRATTPARFISSDNLNAIYNNFVANSGDLNLFNEYLINNIKPGSSGNWTNFFPKYNSRFNANFDEKLDSTVPEQINPIFALNSEGAVIDTPPAADANANTDQNQNDQNANQNNTNTDNASTTTPAKKLEKYKPNENEIWLSVDSTINRTITNQNLFDRLTKYQVRFFRLRQNAIIRDQNNNFILSPIWSSGIYSPSPVSSALEAISLRYAPPVAGNNIGLFQNLSSGWWSIIASLIFALLVGIIVAVIYRIPGLVASLFWTSAITASLATFFGLKLTLVSDSAAGIIAFVIISAMIMLYGLNFFIKQVRQGSSLRQSANKMLGEGFQFGFDIIIPTFFSAILIAFTALLELRSFGLFLSIGTFMLMFVFVFLTNVTNWFLITINNHRPQLFLSKTNRAYLKSLTGELNIESELARKFVSKKYFANRTQGVNDGKLLVDLFSWKTWIYFAFILVILIVGITIIFIPSIGFGSSFILKNGISVNYVVNADTVLGGRNLAEAQAALTPERLNQLVGFQFVRDVSALNPSEYFLRTTNTFDFATLTNEFNQWLQPNTYSIQQTNEFSNNALIGEAFKLIAINLTIMSIYFAMRFNWTSIFQLWLTTFLLIGLSIGIIAIIRITVDRNITGSILIFYVLGLITNAMLLHLYRENFDKWHMYRTKDFFRLINKSIENNWLFYVLFLSIGTITAILGALFNWMELQNLFIYLLIGLIASGLLIIPFGTLIWVLSMKLRQRLFYNGEVDEEHNLLKLKYHIKNRDVVDEELISGINFFPHK